MKVVLLGAGNVATVLGTLAKTAGHNIVQVYSRTITSAINLAAQLGSNAVTDFTSIVPDAELYLVALSDTATQQLHQYWTTKKGLVVHTAGSVAMASLQLVATNYGVLYPLQSLRPGRIPVEPLPLLVDANTSDDLTLLSDFASTLSPLVQHCSDEQRLHLHLSAVLVNNFTNHLYHLASIYCRQKGVDFRLLHPLIMETAERLQASDPSTWQTGPAIRGDEATMEKHIQLLKGQPDLEAIYLLLSESIKKTGISNT